MTARLGILISGRGSNMQAIVRGCRQGRIGASVALIVSNRADAAGLKWALAEGLETVALSHKDYPDRESHDRAIVARLREAGVDWVCLAGYMRLLSPTFIAAFPDRIVNIHPSLLPAFPGLHAQRQAVEHGVRISGCTVHLVDTELDHGPIVAQRAVEVHEHDSEDSLAARILGHEHEAYVEALARLVGQRWRIEGRKVVFEGREDSKRD